MTKAERLFHIVSFLKIRGKADILELAKECSVSQRTVYRDFLSLSKLDVRIYYENGYRLSRTQELATFSVTLEQYELIRFALRFNPLYEMPYFQGKLKAIDLLIQSCVEDANLSDIREKAPTISADNESYPQLNLDERRNISLFWKGANSGRDVKLLLKPSESDPSRQVVGKPLRIAWSKRRWTFEVSDFNTERIRKVPVSSVDRVLSINLR